MVLAGNQKAEPFIGIIQYRQKIKQRAAIRQKLFDKLVIVPDVLPDLAHHHTECCPDLAGDRCTAVVSDLYILPVAMDQRAVLVTERGQIPEQLFCLSNGIRKWRVERELLFLYLPQRADRLIRQRAGIHIARPIRQIVGFIDAEYILFPPCHILEVAPKTDPIVEEKIVIAHDHLAVFAHVKRQLIRTDGIHPGNLSDILRSKKRGSAFKQCAHGIVFPAQIRLKTRAGACIVDVRAERALQQERSLAFDRLC